MWNYFPFSRKHSFILGPATFDFVAGPVSFPFPKGLYWLSIFSRIINTIIVMNISITKKKTDDDIDSLKKENHINGFITQDFKPSTYYKDITNSLYMDALIILRHQIKEVSDRYFSDEVGAKNVDLFMITSSISSPMGPGSDSEAVEIQFGKLKTYLVDSSQFGFEPLLFNSLEKLYCYLPSMRGEDPDSRHLNQFYHCEMEMRGTLKELMPIVEGYIKALVMVLLDNDFLLDKLSLRPVLTRTALENVIAIPSFPQITFDQAVEMLEGELDAKDLVRHTKYGRDITSKGEIRIFKLFDCSTPLWITGYDRDRVPFYQKPDPKNSDRVINGDVIFPPITSSSFGGEIVGAGQRQDSAEEMYESMRRQKNLSSDPYEWYIDLRRDPRYRITSGFGLGVERFLAWSLCRETIRDVAVYPRLKNIKTLP